MFFRIILPVLFTAIVALGSIEGPSEVTRGEGPEDSLQILLQNDPENPNHWLGIGELALKSKQFDLAKGYFDQAIKLSNNAADHIIHAGFLWLQYGKAETSMPYLIPNLLHIKVEQLYLLERTLEERKIFSVAILVLRHHAERTKGISKESIRAAEISFRTGQYALARDILVPFASRLDTGSARLLLESAFLAGGGLSNEVIEAASGDLMTPQAKALAALNFALQGNFKAVRKYLDKNKATVPAAIGHYLQAQEFASMDKNAEAVEHFESALESNWPEFRVIATAELYKHFSVTGNRFKADQLWEDIRDRDTASVYKELLAYHLTLGHYEKQAKTLYKNIYRVTKGHAAVLTSLWDELIEDEPEALEAQVKALLGKDPLDCEANHLAMRYYQALNLPKDVVFYGRYVGMFCSDITDPLFDLATALLSQGKNEEARSYFGKYVKAGGDRKRVPSYLR